MEKEEHGNGADFCPEESSWTFYIQGFMCDDGNNTTCVSSEMESPSLVSDAASSAVKKMGCNLGFSSDKSTEHCNNKHSCLKQKHKNKVIPPVDYDDLEDTASSPVNSPKVSCMNEFMRQKQKSKKDDAEVRRNIFGKGGVYNNCTDIKKRTS